MLLLIPKALPSVLMLRERTRYIGRLVTPRTYSGTARTTAAGVPWAADNDAYSGFDEAAWMRMLEALDPGALFVTAPDVVADAPETLSRFRRWLPTIRRHDLPVALVAQDGMTLSDVPWSELAALFIGGSTAWKLGDAARRLALEAKARGVWLHVGRVNTRPRVIWAGALGADSVDGSGWAKWTERWLRPQIGLFDGQRQGVLW